MHTQAHEPYLTDSAATAPGKLLPNSKPDPVIATARAWLARWDAMLAVETAFPGLDAGAAALEDHDRAEQFTFEAHHEALEELRDTAPTTVAGLAVKMAIAAYQPLFHEDRGDDYDVRLMLVCAQDAARAAGYDLGDSAAAALATIRTMLGGGA